LATKSPNAWEALDASTVGTCIGTGHAACAGLDPMELYARYTHRVEYFHFKDLDGATRQRVQAEKLPWDGAVAAGIFRPLGEG
jgi:inosose dehydratase